MVNPDNTPAYVKLHLKSAQGIRNLSIAEAERLVAAGPDYAIRDLYNAIATGEYPVWTLMLQVMSYEQAVKSTSNPFDVTKVCNIVYSIL